MRLALPFLIALLPLAAHAAPAKPRMVKGVSAALLAEAARRTPVREIDYDQDRCDTRTVAQWLSALTVGQARAISWEGGPCELVGPGIDSGSDWCARGFVSLLHPQDRNDQPVIEVFFEAPVHDRPGKAYAFRGAMQAADGLDMSRFRKDFEYDWTTRFKPPAGAIVDCPDQ
jgi:hypothetical protein